MPFDPSTPEGPSPDDFAGVPLFINMRVGQATVDGQRTITLTFGAVYDESVTTGEAHTMWRLRTPYMTALSVIAGDNISSDLSPQNPSASLSFSERFTTNSAGFRLPPPNNLEDEIPFILDIEFGELGRRRYSVTPIATADVSARLLYSSAMNGTLMGSASLLPEATPSLVPATNLQVFETAAVGTILGPAATPMDFPAGTPVWRFGNGTNSSPPFGIDAAEGLLFVNGALNFATQALYTRSIVLERGGATATVDVQIAVLEAPTPTASLEPRNLSVVEGAEVGTNIGVAATGSNFPAGSPSWRIIDADGAAVLMHGLWAINGTTGELMVAATIPPLADAASHSVTVRLTQGGVSVQVVVSVTVTAAPPPPADISDERPRALAAWTITFPDIGATALDTQPGTSGHHPLRIWTGDGDLVLPPLFTAVSGDREIYAGVGGLVTVGQLNAELSQPVRQATLSISLRVLAPDRRRLFLGDPGSQRVEIGQVISTDGSNWTRIPRTFRGRLSAPRLGEDVYQIDVVQSVADIDRGRPQFLSHEHQTARHPGDLGLEYMREFAAGVDIRWPP